jgi:DNA-binding MarR family transcriptional regulator
MGHPWIYVKKGRLRKIIIEKLDEPQTATELAKRIGRHRSSVSRTLLELAGKGFVTCINPDDDRERHYQLTNQGKKIKAQLRDKNKAH